MNIASKANQATTFPALLVASYAQETSKNGTVNIKFDEVESLKTGEQISVKTVAGTDAPVHGPESAISKLIATFDTLKSKHESLVCAT